MVPNLSAHMRTSPYLAVMLGVAAMGSRLQSERGRPPGVVGAGAELAINSLALTVIALVAVVTLAAVSSGLARFVGSA